MTLCENKCWCCSLSYCNDWLHCYFTISVYPAAVKEIKSSMKDDSVFPSWSISGVFYTNCEIQCWFWNGIWNCEVEKNQKWTKTCQKIVAHFYQQVEVLHLWHVLFSTYLFCYVFIYVRWLFKLVHECAMCSKIHAQAIWTAVFKQTCKVL